jgi:hypothetical protein
MKKFPTETPARYNVLRVVRFVLASIHSRGCRAGDAAAKHLRRWVPNSSPTVTAVGFRVVLTLYWLLLSLASWWLLSLIKWSVWFVLLIGPLTFCLFCFLYRPASRLQMLIPTGFVACLAGFIDVLDQRLVDAGYVLSFPHYGLFFIYLVFLFLGCSWLWVLRIFYSSPFNLYGWFWPVWVTLVFYLLVQLLVSFKGVLVV